MHLPLVFTCLLSLAGPSDAPAVTGRTLVHEAVIEAPASEIWRLFTTSEGAGQWMARKVRIDLRVGGEMRSSYHPDSTLEDEHTIVNRILSYSPQRMLAIQNVQAPRGFEHAHLFQQSWSVMRFEPLDESRTRVRLAGINYGEGPEWDEVYKHFEQGNAYLLGLLQRLVKSPSIAADATAGDEAAPPASALKPVEVETRVAASLDAVWNAWTSSAGAQSFFAPRSNIELQIGGAYEMYFLEDAPEGARGSEGCRILAYEPRRMVSFSWNAPPNLPFARQHHTWVVVDLDEPDNGVVRVRLAHHGFEELRRAHPEQAEQFRAARAYFEAAWPRVLQKLKAELEE